MWYNELKPSQSPRKRDEKIPNWCLNNATITHDDPAKLNELLDAYKAGNLFEHYLPTPRDPDDPTKLIGEGKQVELGGFDWYNFRLNKWGTKWDVGGKDAVYSDNPDGLVLSFNTAWSPPIGLYDKLFELGYNVKATYWEPGMAYCGIWDNGYDNYIEYTDHGMIPVALWNEFNMDEFFQEDEEVA